MENVFVKKLMSVKTVVNLIVKSVKKNASKMG